MLRILTGAQALWTPPAGAIVELDLGCGKGGFTVGLAQRYPTRVVIGADVMLGRLRRGENKSVRLGLTLVEWWRVHAWDLIARGLPDASLTRVHVLCPDPWPKARHRGHRLLTSEFLGRLATKLVPGGTLHLATDNAPYLAFMQAAIAPLPQYQRDDATIADLAGLQTDFERVFADQGIAVTHLGYRRV